MPLLSDEVREAGFSNEGTVQGGFRPLCNIMGLWLIQECRRDWQKQGLTLSWDEIGKEAEAARPEKILPAFFQAGFYMKKGKPAHSRF